MDLLLRLDRDLDGVISDAELEGAHTGLARYVAERIEVLADGTVLAGSLRTVGRWTDRQQFPHLEAQVVYPSGRVIDDVRLRVTLLTDLYAGHRNLAVMSVGDQRHECVFQRGNVYTVQRGAGSHWQVARSFLVLGVEHIFTGYDHILFLFGLLLVGRGFRNLVTIVTSFTLAHSTTLTLATLGLVWPASWTIEGAIALSIAYVGLENLVSTNMSHRWKIAFAFGLVHGFGFATILRDMELPRRALMTSLFAFNGGVELGQLAIVALMIPVLRVIRRTQYQERVIRYASLVIVAMGVYWFYERVF
jgi:hydrogenase/urease accessory protein HupE